MYAIETLLLNVAKHRKQFACTVSTFVTSIQMILQAVEKSEGAAKLTIEKVDYPFAHIKLSDANRVLAISNGIRAHMLSEQTNVGLLVSHYYKETTTGDEQQRAQSISGLYASVDTYCVDMLKVMKNIGKDTQGYVTGVQLYRGCQETTMRWYEEFEAHFTLTDENTRGRAQDILNYIVQYVFQTA